MGHIFNGALAELEEVVTLSCCGISGMLRIYTDLFLRFNKPEKKPRQLDVEKKKGSFTPVLV